MTTTKNKKRCPSCKQHVLKTGYNKNKSTPDGLQSECRACTSTRSKKKTIENRKIRMEIKTRAKAAVIRMEERQPENQAQRDLELRGKDLFLKHLAQYMTDSEMDYKQIAQMAEYSPTTVSAYLNGPEKVSEQFIRQVSKKLPHLAGEWYSYRRFTNQGDIDAEDKPLITMARSEDDKFILHINGEDNYPPMSEVQIAQALNDFLDDRGGYPSDYVIEVFKLVKVGYETKVSHHIRIATKS